MDAWFFKKMSKIIDGTKQFCSVAEKLAAIVGFK